MRNHLILGDWNALCDSCGRKFKASQLMRRWDGMMVCKEDYELRHPQDFLRVQKEQISVPFARPYPAQDTFIPVTLSQYPTDTATISEEISKIFTKYIGISDLSGGGGYNTFAFNAHELNYSGSQANSNEEIVDVSESVSLSLHKTISESVSITESVSVTLVSQSVLNGAAFNTFALG